MPSNEAAVIEELPLPSSEVAEEIAQIGFVPDCARLRWAQQQENRSGGLRVSAQYAVSGECAETWNQDLNAAGFESQMPHGEWIRNSAPHTLVVVAGEGLAGVSYETDHVIEGVHVFELEEAND